MEYIHTNATWNIYIPTQHGIYTYPYTWKIYTPTQMEDIHTYTIWMYKWMEYTHRIYVCSTTWYTHIYDVKHT